MESNNIVIRWSNFASHIKKASYFRVNLFKIHVIGYILIKMVDSNQRVSKFVVKKDINPTSIYSSFLNWFFTHFQILFCNLIVLFIQTEKLSLSVIKIKNRKVFQAILFLLFVSWHGSAWSSWAKWWKTLTLRTSRPRCKIHTLLTPNESRSYFLHILLLPFTILTTLRCWKSDNKFM